MGDLIDLSGYWAAEAERRKAEKPKEYEQPAEVIDMTEWLRKRVWSKLGLDR